MATVKDILAEKGSHSLQAVPTDATVLEATRKMNQHGIGSLVVMEGEQVVGIFTERDVLRRVVAAERDPAHTTVGEVMSRQVICVSPDTDLDELSAIMKQKRIRHLPVSREGEVIGMVSIGDLNAYNSSNQEMTIHYLSDYIYGRV